MSTLQHDIAIAVLAVNALATRIPQLVSWVKSLIAKAKKA